MSQTMFSIATQASILCRGNPVSSFDEGTQEANIFSEIYDGWAREVLAMHPWAFARKRDQLARSVKTQAGWKYLYPIPTEALCVFAVYNSDQPNSPPVRRYEIVSDAEGEYIATNEEFCYCLYTFYKTEARWPGWFVAFAKYSLAALAALPISDDDNLAAQMSVMAYGTPSEGGRGGKFAVAAAISDRQSPPQQYNENEIIALRFS